VVTRCEPPCSSGLDKFKKNYVTALHAPLACTMHGAAGRVRGHPESRVNFFREHGRKCIGPFGLLPAATPGSARASGPPCLGALPARPTPGCRASFQKKSTLMCGGTKMAPRPRADDLHFFWFDRAAAASRCPPACAQLIRGSRTSAATVRGETYPAHFVLARRRLGIIQVPTNFSRKAPQARGDRPWTPPRWRRSVNLTRHRVISSTSATNARNRL